MNEDEVREAVANYRTNNMPLDAVVLDIDYMERYKDFTVDEQRFPHFAAFAAEMKAQGIRLVPIIDAGVKIEDGYDVYAVSYTHLYSLFFFNYSLLLILNYRLFSASAILPCVFSSLASAVGASILQRIIRIAVLAL